MTDTNQLIVNFRGGVGELKPNNPEEMAKARLTAAHYAENAEELGTFLDMLGLREHFVKQQQRPKHNPSSLMHNPGNCRKCGVRMVPRKSAQPGDVRYGGLGLCVRHYAQHRRAVLKEAQ
ncbi:hypothetical protein LTT66_18040 [Nocardia gipuzkoensis]|uniref:hypothetical protein n=1 Tax=Nocardia gipuzkoensis TaxID=2749991 RepID=UPI001E2CC84E|nr:hypothetical protein [Nocardia gipuzkoensis]UGT71873.1 hypothetical protein LTT66_18040 [Nocardia gipuzkoensis]